MSALLAVGCIQLMPTTTMWVSLHWDIQLPQIRQSNSVDAFAHMDSSLENDCV